MYVCMYVCICIYVYIYIYVCLCIWICICMYIYIYLSLSLFIYIYIYIYIHTSPPRKAVPECNSLADRSMKQPFQASRGAGSKPAAILEKGTESEAPLQECLQNAVIAYREGNRVRRSSARVPAKCSHRGPSPRFAGSRGTPATLAIDGPARSRRAAPAQPEDFPRLVFPPVPSPAPSSSLRPSRSRAGRAGVQPAPPERARELRLRSAFRERSAPGERGSGRRTRSDDVPRTASSLRVPSGFQEANQCGPHPALPQVLHVLCCGGTRMRTATQTHKHMM